MDPRARLLVEECFRHSKAVAATPAGEAALRVAGVPAGEDGVVLGEDADRAVRALVDLLPSHRVWDRFPASLG